MLSEKVEPFHSALWVLIAAWLSITGCSNQNNGTSAASAPPVVEVVAVQQRDVPIYSEWIGTLDGFVNADIKAEVSGYLLEQAYAEGSFGKKAPTAVSN